MTWNAREEWLKVSGPLYRDERVAVDGEPWSTARTRQGSRFRRHVGDPSLNLLSIGSESIFFEAKEGSTVILKVRVK